MIELPEIHRNLTIEFVAGGSSTTAEVWALLLACRDGDLSLVQIMTQRNPALIACQYDYTSPLHLAVRDGRFAIVRYLVENGAFDPGYRSLPYKDSLLTIALERGYHDIHALLEQSLAHPRTHGWGGLVKSMDYGLSPLQEQFEDAVSQGDHREVESLLQQSPELAHNELAFWGEGVLMMSANRRDLRMIDILLECGASVPPVSKWGDRYYFKHYDVGKTLLENGMDAGHQNWRRTTLLHEMARLGDIQRAELLLQHGADINAVEEEYNATPLGFAARWGQAGMVSYLLERGADPSVAGASFATPTQWARTRKHADVETRLRNARK
jgi:ankyrin repeat protein